jgi:hypothetical protein
MNFRSVLATLILALPASALAESACELPGILLTDDASGDSPGVVDGGGGDAFAASDIQLLSVAEPSAMTGRIAFTLKVADLSAVPPQHRWQVYFTPADGAERYLAMSTTEGGAPRFEYGTTGVLDNPAAPVGQANREGDLDPASHYAPDGTVTLVFDPALAGVGPGAVLENIHAKIRATSPGLTSNMGLTLDDAGVDAGIYYEVVGNAACTRARSLATGAGLVLGGALGLPALALLGLAAAFGRRRRF